jgi:hypothetical protein
MDLQMLKFLNINPSNINIIQLQNNEENEQIKESICTDKDDMF